jgi:hypothetical protein
MRLVNRQGPAAVIEPFATGARRGGGIGFVNGNPADIRMRSRRDPRHRDARVNHPVMAADDRGGGHRLVVNLRCLRARQGVAIQVMIRELADADK